MSEDLQAVKKLLDWKPPGDGPHYKNADDVTVRRHARELIALVEEHRRILEPLLAKPIRGGCWCLFCGAAVDTDRPDVSSGPHKADCPVLAQGRLLGRTAAEVAG